MLGALYAALSALTFALNNATMRRGVVTGTVLQGMAITVPIGGLTFLVLTIVSGNVAALWAFPVISVAWLVGQGMVHFVTGRYCNYKSNQLMGVNLAAPVIQLQVPVAMLWAVATLHETFTVFQAFGTAMMLGGSFTTQSNAGRSNAGHSKPARSVSAAAAPAKPIFQPRILSGYLFGLGAAFCYGTSPLMAREAFLQATSPSTAAGGCIAYGSATLLFSLLLFLPGNWNDARHMKRENMSWFLSSAVLVAVSQSFYYAALAMAPLMVVTPILQLSLIFRLFLSQMINKDHEVMNIMVIIGAVIAIIGSILVSLDTQFLVHLFGLPEILTYKLTGS